MPALLANPGAKSALGGGLAPPPPPPPLVFAVLASDSAPFTSVLSLPIWARTLKVYDVPLARLVTVWLSVVAPLPAMSVQLPEPRLYSQPDTPAMAVQLSVALALPPSR